MSNIPKTKEHLKEQKNVTAHNFLPLILSFRLSAVCFQLLIFDRKWQTSCKVMYTQNFIGEIQHKSKTIFLYFIFLSTMCIFKSVNFFISARDKYSYVIYTELFAFSRMLGIPSLLFSIVTLKSPTFIFDLPTSKWL